MIEPDINLASPLLGVIDVRARRRVAAEGEQSDPMICALSPASLLKLLADLAPPGRADGSSR
jgi:hypothetical protein